MRNEDEHDPKPEDPRRDDATHPPAGSTGEPRNDDWLQERYPVVDADFVGDTLDRVLQDQEEIAAEAARVDDIQFHPDDLGQFAVPQPSASFIDDTLQKAFAQREAGLWSASASEHEFQELLNAHQPPAPTGDFVERTLQAVLTDRAEQTPRPRLVQGPTSTASQDVGVAPRSGWRRPFTLIASVAAIILCAIALNLGGDPSSPAPSIQFATPASFADLITSSSGEADVAHDAVLGRRPNDGIAFFAFDGAEPR